MRQPDDDIPDPAGPRVMAALGRVRTDGPVYLHGESGITDSARRWLTARGCHVVGYVDVRPRPTGATLWHTIDDVPARARIVIYGAGRDGTWLLDLLDQHRPDVTVQGFIDDLGAAALDALPDGRVRSLAQRLPPPTPLPAFAAADGRDDVIVVVASTNHGVTNLARAAAAGIKHLAYLRFGFAPANLCSYAVDWVIDRTPDAAFVLGENANAALWQALERAQTPLVFTAALWAFVTAPLESDRPLLAELAPDDEDSLRLLERLAVQPAFAQLVRPPPLATTPGQPGVTAPPPSAGADALTDVRLKPLLQSFLARVAARTWAQTAPQHLCAWVAHLASLAGPNAPAALIAHPARTARHFGNYDLCDAVLAAALRAPAPPPAVLLLERAGSLLDRGACDDALVILRALHETDPGDPDVAYLLAGTALYLHRVRGANGETPLPPFLRSLVNRLQDEAQAARSNTETTATGLGDALARFGFGIVRGALAPDVVAALQTHYQSFFDTLDEAGQKALTMGSPINDAQATHVVDGLRASGVSGAIEAFLGTPTRFMTAASFNRYRYGVPADALCVYHQDGRIGNRLTRELTCWVPLVACGRHAPGLELIARRFHGFFPLGDGHPNSRRQASLLPNDLVVPGTTFAPIFTPGDVLVFEKFTPHRTQPMAATDLRNGGQRASMDLRWYGERRI